MMQLQHKRSLWLGILITPWVVPLGFFIVNVIGMVIDDSGGNLPPLNFIVDVLYTLILYSVLYYYVVTLALVAPMFLWLRSKNALSAIRLCIWFAVLGPTTLFIYSVLLDGPSVTWARIDLIGVLYSMALNLINGIIFCMLTGVRLCVRQAA